ncbi:MAG: DegT/DnrJ/EryC1/StrS family aminotransferase [Candidatus Eremiobacteraeota bacterium]|nr:DegT/DnrJ/EryC1/StrS family aminotransferase [Candidatus Eremiobacteraeota bacterium]
MAVIPRFSLALSTGELFMMLSGLPSAGHTMGPIEELEKAFATYIGAKHAFFVPSARLGLFLIIKSMGLPEGSKIIIPAWTHASVPAMARACGLVPCFVDVDDRTFNMNPEAIPDEALREASAIVPTHLYGCPCPMDTLLEKARSSGLKVIEDCAQGCGARYGEKTVGSLGDASYFSFSLTKNFTTMGGGMIATSDPGLAEKLRASLAARSPGAKMLAPLIKAMAFKCGTEPFIFSLTLYPFLRLFAKGGKDPLHEAFEEHVSMEKPSIEKLLCSDLQGRLGLSQLKDLDRKNEARHRWGKLLIEKLGDLGGITLPVIPEKAFHIFLSFVIKCENRGALAAELLKLGVDTSPGYLKACFLLPELSSFRRECPVAEGAATRQLHLPLYPSMTEGIIDHIAKSLKAAHGKIKA